MITGKENVSPMKALWLASSYPSQIFPYDGDFIQRHAQATSLFCQVEVLHVVKDENCIVTKDVKEIIVANGQLIERIIYYKPLKTSIKILDRFLSGLKYNRVSKTAVKRYIEQNERPAFFHLHMAMKAGLTALWAKRKYKIPYLLTEHWTRYLNDAVPHISNYNFIYRHYLNNIVKGAKASTYVSKFLQKQVEEKFGIQNTQVVPNVVNTGIFYFVEKLPADKIRFIHISTMGYQKNPEAILSALALLKDEFEFELFLYGPVTPTQQQFIHVLGLENRVFLKGEVPQQELAKTMQQCDALILYSRFETFGCVLIEANACGIPVIVSDLEVFHEIVEDGVNGVFAEGEKSAALAEKIKEFVAKRNSFNKQTIAATAAEKYNYKKIGGQFFDLYKKLQAQ